MLAYSSNLFTAPNGGSDWCAFDDPPIYYYNGLQDQEYLSCDHYNQQAIPPSDLSYHYSFDDQLVPLPSVYAPTFPAPPACFGGGFQTTSLPAVYNDGISMTVLAVAKEDEEEKQIMGDDKKKKQDHNASERNRRKRINETYDSLRALLPATDQMKKLSIPSTVGRAVKYIPELQNEVQNLLQRKENLLPAATTSVFSQLPYDNKTAILPPSSSALASCTTVEATQLGNGEISIQISALKSLQNTFVVPISEVLRELEEVDGVLVVDISSSESSVGRVFYRIHLMVEGTNDMKCEILREKVLSSCQKWGNLYCLWMN